MDKTFQDKEDWIYGYKAFFEGMVNQYNQQFELGKIYVDPNIDKNYGFHFCKNIEDIFVFSQFRENLSIYEVCGGGKITPYSNEYYGIYDVYAAEKLKIIREVSREEIIQHYLSFGNMYCSDRLLRFLQLFTLTKEEIQLFKEKFHNQERVLSYIGFYQEGNENAFSKKKII